MLTLDDLPTLVRGVNSKRPFDAFFALVLGCFGVASFWGAARIAFSIPALVVGVVGVGGALLQLRSVLRGSRAHPGIAALLDRPEQIIWWYVVSSGPRRTIRLHLEDGKIYDIPLRYTLPLLGRKDVEAAASEIAPLLAHATAGCSYEHHQAYGRDPSSLRRTGAAGS